jgi:hypothetical protein
MIRRLALYAAIGVLVWQLSGLLSPPSAGWCPRAWSGSHSPSPRRGTETPPDGWSTWGGGPARAHAGIWVGGLIVLVVLGRTVERREWLRFGTLALACVLALVATGALNSLREINAVEELWQTRYGVVLVPQARPGGSHARRGRRLPSALQQDRAPGARCGSRVA